MCGIAGCFGPFTPSDKAIERTLTLMHRRGPDNQSSWSTHYDQGRSLSLLHSRLSILDLDPRSHQPFHAGHASLIFNGEIYNYVELRNSLIERGVPLVTSSDTEVLIHYYLLYGEECFSFFEGMWSCALYDHRDKSLLLSRDRFGEKPLLWFRFKESIFFASQVQFIESLSESSLTVHDEKLVGFLTAGFRSLFKDTSTFFKDVFHVPAGSYLKILRDGSLVEKKYFRIDFSINDEMTEEMAINGIREKFIKSMELRLRSDVPLAFCLSGGVDSGAVLSVAKKCFGVDAHAFSVVDSDERYNESDLIQETVKDLGIRHTVKTVSHDGFFDRMRDLTQYHESPLSTISYYVHSMLSEAISEHGYKVSFSGAGADELFSGYYDHFLLHIAESGGDAEVMEAWSKWIQPIVRNPSFLDPSLFIHSPQERSYLYQDQDFFVSLLDQKQSLQFIEEKYCNNPMRNRMLNELFHEIIPVILWEDDLNSMFYSIENRSPFLDSELYHFACSIPPRLYIKNGYGKFLLREALRGILNEPVRLNRQKKGFNASINSLINFSDPHVVKLLTDDSPIFKYVSRDKIKSLFKHNTTNTESKFLFSFVSAKIFLEIREGISRN